MWDAEDPKHKRRRKGSKVTHVAASRVENVEHVCNITHEKQVAHKEGEKNSVNIRVASPKSTNEALSLRDISVLLSNTDVHGSKDESTMKNGCSRACAFHSNDPEMCDADSLCTTTNASTATVRAFRDDKLILIQCKERQWAFTVVFDYFNYKKRSSPKWLHFSTIFMCMDLIDKFLYSSHFCSLAALEDSETRHSFEAMQEDEEVLSAHRDDGFTMRLLDGDQCEQRHSGESDKKSSAVDSGADKRYMKIDQVLRMAICCMYISMKFHIGFSEFPTMEEFNISKLEMDMGRWEVMERDIVVHCLECMMYSPTLLDVACDRGIDLSLEDISKLLMVMQCKSLKCGMMKSDLLDIYLSHLRQISLDRFPEL